ncbi:Diaminopimelate decarboxylase [Sphingomonas paucimobilis]|nr:Diaminopimelate decarboxylase [Sphingomonas paucimobilis]
MQGRDGPLFVYDPAIVAARVARFRAAFPTIDLHYAIKANPFPPLLAAMAGLVDGFDVASSGELAKVVELGKPVSFAGRASAMPNSRPRSMPGSRSTSSRKARRPAGSPSPSG